MTEEDFDEDYGMRVVNKLRKVIRLFFKELGSDHPDDSQVQSFCDKVRLVTADLALGKACEYMMSSGLFPNLITYQRDPSHAIRIAIRDPLHRGERIGVLMNMLFNDEHSLLKDLRFSDLWHAKVTYWQKELIKKRGFLGGDVKDIIRNFSFAPQRFESFCTPLFQVLIAIPAICLTLKHIAEDGRDAGAVQRALTLMKAINAQWILDVGLTSDYGSISLELLRQFDRHSRDPSTTKKHIRQWKEKINSLFREGNIFRECPSTAAGQAAKSATAIAMEQIKYMQDFDYAGRIKDFMDVPPHELFKRGMTEMNAIITPAMGRIATDFAESSLYMSLEIFDLDEWVPLLLRFKNQSLLDMNEAHVVKMKISLRIILNHYSRTHFKNIDDWALVVEIAMRHRDDLLDERPQRNTSVGLDHRISWALAVAKIADVYPWADIPVRVYLAWMDGTVSVERGLGLHAQVLASHVGTHSDRQGLQ